MISQREELVRDRGLDTQIFHISKAKSGLPYLRTPMLTSNSYTGRSVVLFISHYIYTICHIICNKCNYRNVTNVTTEM